MRFLTIWLCFILPADIVREGEGHPWKAAVAMRMAKTQPNDRAVYGRTCLRPGDVAVSGGSIVPHCARFFLKIPGPVLNEQNDGNNIDAEDDQIRQPELVKDGQESRGNEET